MFDRAGRDQNRRGPGALPLRGAIVDEESWAEPGGRSRTSYPLDKEWLIPRNYVLISNVPVHYQQGIHTGFAEQ